MSDTKKDTRDYRPVTRGRRGFTMRGCNLHGRKDCSWCLGNQTIATDRKLQDDGDAASEGVLEPEGYDE